MALCCLYFRLVTDSLPFVNKPNTHAITKDEWKPQVAYTCMHMRVILYGARIIFSKFNCSWSLRWICRKVNCSTQVFCLFMFVALRKLVAAREYRLDEQHSKRDLIADYCDFGSQVFAPKTCVGFFPERNCNKYQVDSHLLNTYDGRYKYSETALVL